MTVIVAEAVVVHKQRAALAKYKAEEKLSLPEKQQKKEDRSGKKVPLSGGALKARRQSLAQTGLEMQNIAREASAGPDIRTLRTEVR